MKKLFLLTLGVFAIFCSWSQGKVPNGLSGKITDAKTGEPVARATLYINDLKLGVATDSAGRYTFKNLPAGNFLVEARSVGYKATTRSVAVKGVSEEDFQLQENVIEESEIVVTGLSKATQIKRSPIPIVSINHNYLASNINTNIIDAITKVPGITAVTTGPNVSKPYIRGLGFNRILTLYDGVRQEGQQWGDEHGIEVDQYSIDRIEAVKGPASLSYGSDALAGVVNLIPTQPAPEGKIVGELLGEYQANNGLVAGSGMLSGTKNGLEWMGRISHKQATNYRNKIDGRVYGTSFNETDATAYLGLHKSWGYSHLSFSLFNDFQRIPDGSRDSASRRFTKQIDEADTLRPIVSEDELKSYQITNATHQHIRHYRIYSNNSFTLGNGRLSLNLGFQNSIREEFSHPQFLSTPGLSLNLHTYNYDIKYFFPDLNGWNISLGANGMYQKNDVTKGTEFVIPSYHQFDVGPFVLVKKTFGKLDLSGGLRYDTRSFTSDPLYTTQDPSTGFDMAVGSNVPGADNPFSAYSHTFTGASGSLGLTYNATEKLSFKANVARGYRAPNISEISANGVHPGTNIYQIGNAAFQPEFSLQEDIGFVYASQFVVVNLSLFNNHIQNYIFNQKLQTASGADSVIVAGNQTFKFQQSNARLYGGEVNIDFHPVKALHFENSFSLVYGENKGGNGIKIGDDAKYLPFIPPFHGVSELRFDFGAISRSVSKGYLKAQWVFNAAQNRVYTADNTETPTPGYSLFNVGAGTGFNNKSGKTIFTVSVIANNLFDVAYQDHLSRLKYFEPYPDDPRRYHGIYNMGRNVAFKLIFPLAYK